MIVGQKGWLTLCSIEVIQVVWNKLCYKGNNLQALHVNNRNCINIIVALPEVALNPKEAMDV